ncbi:MAG: 1-acyl-sn-glycerol-3-phosphate acyltransferase [Oscillospiraceae bacterium]|nr:1-acyl-sn-glycerol-3-phosphate acyltransferase [Oscillospiraceae bacterium]
MPYACIRAIIYLVYLILYRFRVLGRENVPPGGAVVCANHTSLADPVLAALAFKANDRPFFMAKSELFKNPLFGLLIKLLGAFPVERGASDLGALKHSLELLREGKKLLMFPQGTRFSDAETLELKSGVAMLALRTGLPILPVYITQGRKLFINRIEVSIGVPFTPERKPGQDKNEAYHQITSRLAADIQALRPCKQKECL